MSITATREPSLAEPKSCSILADLQSGGGNTELGGGLKTGCLRELSFREGGRGRAGGRAILTG